MGTPEGSRRHQDCRNPGDMVRRLERRGRRGAFGFPKGLRRQGCRDSGDTSFLKTWQARHFQHSCWGCADKKAEVLAVQFADQKRDRRGTFSTSAGLRGQGCRITALRSAAQTRCRRGTFCTPEGLRKLCCRHQRSSFACLCWVVLWRARGAVDLHFVPHAQTCYPKFTCQVIVAHSLFSINCNDSCQSPL